MTHPAGAKWLRALFIDNIVQTLSDKNFQTCERRGQRKQ